MNAARRLGVDPVITAGDMANPEVDHIGIMAYAVRFQQLVASRTSPPKSNSNPVLPRQKTSTTDPPPSKNVPAPAPAMTKLQRLPPPPPPHSPPVAPLSTLSPPVKSSLPPPSSRQSQLQQQPRPSAPTSSPSSVAPPRVNSPPLCDRLAVQLPNRTNFTGRLVRLFINTIFVS